jgi:redox-sensitive bicupin YhaK (pirin superfamily)
LGRAVLLVAARPLREAIASRDPVDMSARAEIEQTLRDLRSGPFISGDLRGE